MILYLFVFAIWAIAYALLLAYYFSPRGDFFLRQKIGKLFKVTIDYLPEAINNNHWTTREAGSEGAFVMIVFLHTLINIMVIILPLIFISVLLSFVSRFPF